MNTTSLEDGYQNISFVAQGGFAAVYSGFHEGTDRQCAIKIMDADRENPKTANHEIETFRILTNHSHDNVVTLFELWHQDADLVTNESIKIRIEILLRNTKRLLCMSMQLCDGNLDSLIRERDAALAGDDGETLSTGNKQFSPDQKKEQLNIMKQIASGLSYLHGKGLIHRDLKPENILFLDTGKGRVFKISDFSLCRLLSTDAMTECGSAHYVAPEVLLYNYSESVDIHSLGVILLRLAFPLRSGSSLGDTIALMRRPDGRKYPESLRKDYPSMCDLIHNMISKKPQRRIKLSELIKLLSQLSDYDVKFKIPRRLPFKCLNAQ
jgi:serine/threonine protein kinase